ncbi:hypothetical protein SLS62_009870 [Diatrype stigma]|uniref:Rhodopsin domain-containing protein n=1 Tax=Diatrype stigma TaxID=117547 RepID=A0AAN9YJI7_9PEZI
MSLSQPSEINALKYQALATATYVLNMWLTKLSIAIFLLRIALQKRYRRTIYVSMTIITIWSLALFFWDVFQCTPVKAQWDYTILQRDPNAICASADSVVMAAYALSVMNILSDWLYALLPIPMIWNVKMTTEAKVTVSMVLGLGIFASIATLVRLKFLADLMNTSDILHNGTDAMVWTLIEPGVAIIASSLATIRPLLRAMGIRGFQFSEHSTRPRKSNATHSNTYQSQDMRRSSCRGSADVTLAEIELAHTKGRATRPLSDPGALASRGLPPKFTARRMSRVEEGRDENGRTTPPPLWRKSAGDDDSGTSGDSESGKSLEAGYRRTEIRRNNGMSGVVENRNNGNNSTNNGSRPTTASRHLHPGPTWLETEQNSSRESSVDYSGMQPQHSPVLVGLGTPYSAPR